MLALVQLPGVECPEIDNVIFGNVMNTVLEPVSVCLVERNILVPAYFGIPFQGVSRFLNYRGQRKRVPFWAVSVRKHI